MVRMTGAALFAVWSAVYAAACVELQDAMDLNYLTGQQPADVFKMRLADIAYGRTTINLKLIICILSPPSKSPSKD